ncbi:hypothetical protein D1007_60894 [Hordeum vulgare]|nr:hypothetical protein D1007_60894 [Hordeum vulgare]
MSSCSASQKGLSGQIMERLTRSNYVLWRAQITPQLRGAGFFGYADGTMLEPVPVIITKDKDEKEETSPNPLHQVWVKDDQQSIARVNNVCIALANAQKRQQSTTAYFAHMLALADDLTDAQKPIKDDEVVSYILARMDMEYHPLVSAIDARTMPVSLEDIFVMMRNFDQRVDFFHGSGNPSASSLLPMQLEAATTTPQGTVVHRGKRARTTPTPKRGDEWIGVRVKKGSMRIPSSDDDLGHTPGIDGTSCRFVATSVTTPVEAGGDHMDMDVVDKLAPRLASDVIFLDDKQEPQHTAAERTQATPKACEIESKYTKVESERNQLQLDYDALKKTLEDKDKVLAKLKEKSEADEQKLADISKLTCTVSTVAS